LSLEAEDLTYTYGAAPALSGVSLALAAGEVLGVLGLNGAGKSTLLRLMLGLAEPQSGTVRIDGVSLSSLSLSDRARRVAAVLQHEQLGFPYTGRELVVLGRYAHRGRFAALTPEDERLVSEALQAVDAAHLAERRVNQLSGGEQRRVLMARALAQQPQYLLLDEPTAALDVPHQLELGALVRKLAAERAVGVLWVMHDINLALRGCDRVAILAHGRLVFAGPPREAFSPEHLRQVFHVEGELVRDSAGLNHIVFRPLSGDSGPHA
jgi:iron complex transport system ATP-binding protein